MILWFYSCASVILCPCLMSWWSWAVWPGAAALRHPRSSEWKVKNLCSPGMRSVCREALCFGHSFPFAAEQEELVMSPETSWRSWGVESCADDLMLHSYILVKMWQSSILTAQQEAQRWGRCTQGKCRVSLKCLEHCCRGWRLTQHSSQKAKSPQGASGCSHLHRGSGLG